MKLAEKKMLEALDLLKDAYNKSTDAEQKKVLVEAGLIISDGQIDISCSFEIF